MITNRERIPPRALLSLASACDMERADLPEFPSAKFEGAIQRHAGISSRVNFLVMRR